MLAALIAALATTSIAPFDRLTIMAPASAGGGWDQTARAMQRVLLSRGAAREIEVVNSPGAGGAIGLAQFVNAQKGDGRALLVGGLVMVSAIRANRATVSLLQATPLARLTGDYEVVAVPSGSDLRTLDDLVEALRTDPGGVSWAGGSGGGPDQMLVGLVAQAAGVEPVRMNYVPFTGGGEVADALATNKFTAGVSGWAEMEPALRAGRLRALAISSDRRLPGVDVPTFKEQGLDVALMNWRGVFAPPGISEHDRVRLLTAVDGMVKDPAWSDALRRHQWQDLYLAGDAFARFVHAEQARVAAGPDPRAATIAGQAAPLWRRGLRALRARPLVSTLFIGLAVALALFVTGQSLVARRRERALSRALEAARADAQRNSAHAQEVLRGLGEQIDRQFEAWKLTSAEREVGLLMLKGLKHREIASLRGTSERTVRGQALTIYKKAGLDGRTDLAAFFLEDLLVPGEPSARPGAA